MNLWSDEYYRAAERVECEWRGRAEGGGIVGVEGGGRGCRWGRWGVLVGGKGGQRVSEASPPPRSGYPTTQPPPLSNSEHNLMIVLAATSSQHILMPLNMMIMMMMMMMRYQLIVDSCLSIENNPS